MFVFTASHELVADTYSVIRKAVSQSATVDHSPVSRAHYDITFLHFVVASSITIVLSFFVS